MDNNLIRVSSSTSNLLLPYCIWYPKVPHFSTLEALATLRPDMTHQVARACIVGNHENLFDELDPDPDHFLLTEARASPNTYFLQRLESKFVLIHKDGSESAPMTWDGWKRYTIKDTIKALTTILSKHVSGGCVVAHFSVLYGYSVPKIGDVELHVSCVGGSTEPIVDSRSTLYAALASQDMEELWLAHNKIVHEGNAYNGSSAVAKVET